MNDTYEVRPDRRPVGRGKKLRTAVLAATLEELNDVGYGDLTIEGVARRAGVHKTSIYRRWGDRERLVVDAISDHVTTEVPVPNTGAIDTDLRALARGLVRWLTSPPGQAILSTMVSDARRLGEIEQARRDFYAHRFREAAPVITRAIERGDLPTGTDPAEVLKTLVAPIYLRLLVTSEPIDEAVADNAAEITLAAARAGILRRRDEDPS
ncbi:MAG TPA: TetR/AcrR family transcriptional regulator [Thermomicrobiales bacterium]|nr:TetR/AcrR family transcriptional regulator [Thermomicrobiales bacterium]